MIHIPCRYVGLTWSLSLIGHLYVSGVLQGSLVRRDTTLCFHVNVCHACSWGPCSRDSIYSWATDLGKQPHVQGFYVSVYFTCACGGQIRGLPTCNVGHLWWKNYLTTFYLLCNHFRDMTQPLLALNLIFVDKWPMWNTLLTPFSTSISTITSSLGMINNC